MHIKQIQANNLEEEEEGQRSTVVRWKVVVGETVMTHDAKRDAHSGRTRASSRMSGASSRASGMGAGAGSGKDSGGGGIDQDTGQEDLVRMQEIFEEADEDGGGGLDIDEFKVAMKKVLGGRVDERELEKLFMKVDTNCDGTVDWDEFLSYMLLEYLEKDLIKAMMMEQPFVRDEVELPRKHSHLIVRVRHTPLTRSVSFTHSVPIPHRGRYYTLDESGVINVWNHAFHHTRKLRCPPRGHTPLCCRDMAVMANLSLIAVASTLNELWLFDVSKFEKQCSVTRLPYSIECMHYHYDYTNSNRSCLLWGDTGGNVFIIALTETLLTSFFSDTLLNSKREMPLDVFSSGKFPHCKFYQHKNIHSSWTRQIKFLPGSSQFISCSWASQNSMVVSLLRENGRPPYVFHVTKGVTCFDYSEELNVIVTAGVDHRVKIWDPYMPSQPLNILVGHNARVEFVCIDTVTNSILSLSADNYVKVWDIADTKVTQSFNANYVHLQPHDVTAVAFNPIDGKLILATKEIVFRERTGNLNSRKTGAKVEDPKSHGKGVTCVLYNPVFEVVVSADQHSTVCVWDYKNGKKLMQFSGCHLWNINGRIINLEITAMAFDPTYRRLFTGSKDGFVKVWNFNNGSCLDQYETCDENEIGGMVYMRNRIFTGGWSKNVYCIFDAKEDDDRDIKCWEQKHVDDIQCITRVGTFVVSADYDGDIIFWYSDTGRFAFRYNVNECASSIQTPRELEFNEVASDVIGSKSRAESRRSMYTGRRSKTSSSRENIYNRNRSSGFSQHSSGRKFHSASKRVVEPLEEKYCSVVTMTSLNSRVLEPTTATLLTATSFGWVYAWAASVGTKMLGQFFAAKSDKVAINATATDPSNLIFVTGDCKGHIRVWSVKRVAIGRKERERLLEVADYNIAFPFAPYLKKVSRQLAATEPLEIFAEIPKLSVPLLASFKGHLGAVTALDIIPESHLIVSGSSDGSVKLFTVAGKSIGTFGQPRAWRSINYYLSDSSRGTIPYNLKRASSPSSNMIMRGKKIDHWASLKTIFKTSQIKNSMLKSRGVNARRETERSSDSDSDDGKIPTLDEEEREELFKDDFSFDIRSDLLGAAYKGKEPSNKHKYMSGFKTRECMVDSSDVYHNLHVDHELEKLPDLPKPPLLKEVLAKQNAIQNDIQKMRQRQGMLKVVKMTVSNARIGKTTKGLPLNPKPAKQLLAKSLDAATLDRSIQSNARKFGKRASIE